MRKLLAFAVPFCAGAAFGLFFQLVPLAGVLLAAGLVLLPWRSKALRLSLILLGAGFGMLWSWGYNALQLPSELSGQELVISGVALGYSQESSNGLRVEAKISAQGETSRAYVYLSSAAPLKPGDQFTVTAQLEDTYSDGETYGRSVGIWLFAYGVGSVQVVHCDKIPLIYGPKVLAHNLEAVLSQSIPEETLGCAIALTTGNRSLLRDSVKANLKSAGIYHVLALSGMHLTVLVGMLRLVFRRKKHLALVGIPVCILFAVMTGLSASIVRAAVMECLLLGSHLLSREADTPSSLGLAVLLLTLQNPWCLLNWGLQLSFFSVIGLYLFSDRLLNFFSGKRSLRHFLADSLAATLSATAITLPLQAAYFGMISLVSPVSNLLVCGVVSIGFGLCLLTAFCGLFAPSLGLLLGKGADLCLRYVLLVTKAMAQIPFGVCYTSSFYSCCFLVILYCILLLLLLFPGSRKRIPLCCIVCTFSLCVLLNLLENSGFRFTVLDVGQGQCLLFQMGNQTIMVDCGGNSGNAGDTAADFLAAQGLSRVDLLILTHYDSDHISGVTELMERVSVEALLLPNTQPDEALVSLANAQNVRLSYVSSTTYVTFGSCMLEVFPSVLQGQDNNSSLSMLCQAGDLKILVTGDMDEDAEAELLSTYALPDLDILVAGHHGSRTSTSQALLEQTMPQIAVISVGANRYGHPAQQTLDRILSIGASIYRTDQDGTITFKGA